MKHKPWCTNRVPHGYKGTCGADEGKRKQLEKLDNPKEVMEAFLSGSHLICRKYGDDELGECFIYLSEDGYLCEEDGAGLKADRLDLTFRDEDPNWRILCHAPQQPSATEWESSVEASVKMLCAHYLAQEMARTAQRAIDENGLFSGEFKRLVYIIKQQISLAKQDGIAQGKKDGYEQGQRDMLNKMIEADRIATAAMLASLNNEQ